MALRTTRREGDLIQVGNVRIRVDKIDPSKREVRLSIEAPREITIDFKDRFDPDCEPERARV